MTAAARLAATAALALLTGCATLNPPPPVDLLPTTPPPVAATPRPQVATTGSLFHAASYRPAFEDRRARLVGDIVTIQIVEKVTAKQNSTSTIDRSSETSAGISAFPMAARVVQREAQKENFDNFILMHAMGANAAGQVASVVAGGVLLALMGAA